MNGIAQALVELRAERDRIDRAIQVLEDFSAQPRRLALGGVVIPLPAKTKISGRGFLSRAKAPGKAQAKPQSKSKKRKSPAGAVPKLPQRKRTGAGRGKLAARETEIQRRFAAGESVPAIARDLGCSRQAIDDLAKRRGWKRKPAASDSVPVRRIPPGVGGRKEEDE